MYIVRHEFIPIKDGYNLIIYLDPNGSSLTEFSRELFDKNSDNDLPVINRTHYLSSHLDRVKIYSIKIIVGSMLVAVIPINKEELAVSANYEYSSTETYTVVSGDSLFIIATRFNTTVSDLKALNNFTSVA